MTGLIVGSVGGVDADEAALARFARELAEALGRSVPPWMAACVRRRAAEAGLSEDERVRQAARRAEQAARDAVVPELDRLLGTDIDDQATTPLSIVRNGLWCATDALRDLGVAPVPREAFEREAFPADHYALTPASFADIDEALREPGLYWGAAKAHVHLARRRAEGRR